jgi:hypothetical protein
MSGRRRANRHRVAAVLFDACGCRSRFETMSVNVADKVDEKMCDIMLATRSRRQT